MSIRKGQKGLKNVPYIYEEVKRTHGISVTNTAWNMLQTRAKEQGLSVSEMIEKWIRETAG